jgi:hypothetical protein
MPTISPCPINLVVDNHTFGSVTFPLKNDQDSIVTGILAAFNNEQYGIPNENTMLLEQPSENKQETVVTEPVVTEPVITEPVITEPTKKIESMNNSYNNKNKDNIFNTIKNNPNHYRIFKIIMIILLIFVVFGVLQFE